MSTALRRKVEQGSIVNLSDDYTEPEDEAIEDGVSEGVEVQGVPSKVTLGQHRLIHLWECGILGTLAYVFFAIECDRAGGKPFDIDVFCDRWEGLGRTTDEGKEIKPKELKRSAVLKALAALEEKGQVSLEKTQIQLTLL